MDTAIPQGVKILTDVNILAIGLTDDHPAYDDVWPWLRDALDWPNVLREIRGERPALSAERYRFRQVGSVRGAGRG